MTWQDDLATTQAREHDDVIAEAAAIAEAARARTSWLERLRAAWAAGRPVRLLLAGGHEVGGVVSDIGDDVVEVTCDGATWLVRPGAVVLVPALAGVLPAGDAADAGPPARVRVRLTWGMALRPWVGGPVAVHLREVAGRPTVTGGLVGVGADHLDIRLGTAMPGIAAGTVVTLPVAAVAAVRVEGR